MVSPTPGFPSFSRPTNIRFHRVLSLCVGRAEPHAVPQTAGASGHGENGNSRPAGVSATEGTRGEHTPEEMGRTWNV